MKAYLNNTHVICLGNLQLVDMNGWIGVVDEIEFEDSPPYQDIEFTPIPELNVNDSIYIKRSLLNELKGNEIIYSGIVYKDKMISTIVFDKLSFWARLCLLFNSCVVIRCETYLSKELKGFYSSTINMTSISIWGKIKLKKELLKNKNKRCEEALPPPVEAEESIEGSQAP